MQKIDFCLILTATINPGQMPDLVRKDSNIRLDDYKKSFEFWLRKSSVSKIVLIENSNYDLSCFHDLAKKYQNEKKEVEILSNNLNSKFDKSLGKGYGQYLCLNEVFKKSLIAKKTNYFIDVTGRHCVTNFEKILKDINLNETDIYINLSDNFKFCDANIYAGNKEFFINYIIPETSKTNDVIGDIFEKCVAKAVLKAVSDGYSLSKTPVYPIIEGYIGTNGKKYKHNFFKRLKLFFFRKLKIYFLNHKKY
jgi:hypothetical protein